MSLVDEVALWSAIAGKMTTEIELSLAQHAETTTRNAIIVEESEAFIWIMRRAAGEWQRAIGYLRREYDALGDRIAEDRRRAAADQEVEDMRRNKEARDTANALRREVESLSALRDRLRDEVSAMSQSSQPVQMYQQRQVSDYKLNAAERYPAAMLHNHLNTTAATSNLGSPIGPSSPHHSSAAAGGNVATTNTSLGVLRSVREQLREIRETNNVNSPQRTGTPARSSSPSAQQWKERLSKLQGDLRTLRSELGTTPYRGQGGAAY